MGQVTIREYRDMARPRAGGANVGTGLLRGPLVTDEIGAEIKTVTTSAGTPVDCDRLTAKTHFVAIESDSDVRYAVRPKSRAHLSLSATERHPFVPAGTQIVEAVYPGAVISFLQTSGDAQSGPSQPYLQVYVPVLAF